MDYRLNLPDSATIVGQWLYDWQTLLSGLLALGAAFLAARQIQKQIVQAENFYQAEISRRHAAVRCILPLALSGISSFLQAMANSVAEEIERLSPPTVPDDGMLVVLHIPTSKFDPMIVPSDQTADVKDFVETLTRPSDVRHIAELTAQLQVLQARYNDFDFSQVCVADRLHALLLDVAIVGLLNDSIFNYARAVDEAEFGIVGRLSNSDAWDKVQKTLNGLIFSRARIDMFSQEASNRIKRYKDNGTSPWLERFEA